MTKSKGGFITYRAGKGPINLHSEPVNLRSLSWQFCYHIDKLFYTIESTRNTIAFTIICTCAISSELSVLRSLFACQEDRSGKIWKGNDQV